MRTERRWARFVAKIRMGQANECWDWQGEIIPPPAGRRPGLEGYGRFTFEGKRDLAHRVAYELWIGPIPEGFQVQHTCNNPKCCNFNHLTLGKAKENAQYREESGRGRWGEDNPRAKLTEQQVRDIYEKYKNTNASTGDIAKEYGMNQSVISDIVGGRIWKHLELPPLTRRVGERLKFSKLNSDDIKEIRRAYDSGEFTMDALAEMYKVGTPTIHKIVHRKAWKHVE